MKCSNRAPVIPIQPMTLKSAALLLIPMLLDLAATILLSIGLLVTTASVNQMLRGSGMVFAALFAVIILKRSLHKCACRLPHRSYYGRANACGRIVGC